MYVRFFVEYDEKAHPTWAQAVDRTPYEGEVLLDNGLKLHNDIDGLRIQRSTYPFAELELEDFTVVRVEILENDVALFPRTGVYHHDGADGFVNSYGHPDTRHWDLKVSAPDLKSARELYDLIRADLIRPVMEYRGARRHWSWKRLWWV